MRQPEKRQFSGFVLMCPEFGLVPGGSFAQLQRASATLHCTIPGDKSRREITAYDNQGWVTIFQAESVYIR